MTALPPDRARWDHNIQHHPLVLAALPAGCRRALDVGCGEGLLTRRLRQQVDEVVGLDRHAPSLRDARRQDPDHRVTYLRGDLVEHPFAPASFDLVTCVATLHHLDAARGLAAMAGLLRPGGRLVVIGLAASRLPRDLPWELAGTVTHRVLATRRPRWEHGAPTVWPPPETYRSMRRIADRVLPGHRWRRHPLWRYSLVWTRP